MSAKQLVSIGLASILWVGSTVVVGTQSNWPTARKPTVARQAPAAKKSRKPTSRPKRRKASTKPVVRADEAALRTISDIIARQTLAIEALTLRLEAAERRLDEAALAAATLDNDVSDPFRATRAVDWAQVFDQWNR